MMVFSNASSEDQIAAFHQWYDEVHLKEVLQVPGVISACRYEYGDDQMLPGANPFGKQFLAVYEIEAKNLKSVSDHMMATSADRTHSDTLELDPLPTLAIFKQHGPRIEK
jgi:hypothetical protein